MIKDKKHTSDSNINDSSKIKNIDLANFEKLGSIFIIIGYALFSYSAHLDILDLLDNNNTGLTASSVVLQGAQLNLYGYIILFIVSNERLKDKIKESSKGEYDFSLSPYYKLYYSYSISVLLNWVRLDALTELDFIDRNSDTLV